MNLLEERYRRVLRLLPASYRAEREEEMVAAFLESAAQDTEAGDTGQDADEDMARPGWSEIASVAALAVRLRLGGVGAPPRPFAWGEAVRLSARLGMLFHAALACVSLGGLLRLYGVLGAGSAAGIDPDTILGPAGSAERLGRLADSAPLIAWTAAYVALIYGHRNAAKALAVLAVLPAIYRLVADLTTMIWTSPGHAAGASASLRTDIPYVLLAGVPVLALLAGFHRDAPATRRPSKLVVPLLVTGAVLTTALGAVVTEPGLDPRIWPLIDPGGLFCLLLLATTLTYTGVHLIAPVRRSPSWPLALLLLLGPALTTRIAALDAYSSLPAVRPGMVTLLTQIITAPLTALLLLAMATPMLRRLPATLEPTQIASGRQPLPPADRT
jgi:hypothetical protein